MAGPHEKIIAAEAKRALAPLGFNRKGRSRLWLADYGSWLNIVEFTPMRWTKGTYVMNSAHWLWCGTGHLSFDYLGEKRPNAEFESEEQFRSEMVDLANLAAKQAIEIKEQFPNLETIRQHTTAQAKSGSPMSRSWWGYQAGLTSILTGHLGGAHTFLGNIDDDRVIPFVEQVLSVGSDNNALRTKVLGLLSNQREALKLPPTTDPLSWD